MKPSLDISIANRQQRHAIDPGQLRTAVFRVLADAGIESGEVSVAIVDDGEMHKLNRDHLEHDYPTDVLSFVLERSGSHLEGEIIASADYAAAEAQRYGWPAENELLLYVVHGALHLVGHDDTTPEAAAVMRAAERSMLVRFGLTPPGRE